MHYTTARSAKKTANKTANKTAHKADKSANHADHGTALHRCYGQIGISAVAAAARYQGVSKNPAYAPVANRWDDRIEGAA